MGSGSDGGGGGDISVAYRGGWGVHALNEKVGGGGQSVFWRPPSVPGQLILVTFAF